MNNIINITSAEIQVRYSDISETFIADIIINDMMKVTSDFQSKEPGALFEMLRDAGINMRNKEVKPSFKWEPRKYSDVCSIIHAVAMSGNYMLYTVINGHEFEYPGKPGSMMEAFKMGCEIIKRK